jgi:hypothetical protein
MMRSALALAAAALLSIAACDQKPKQPQADAPAAVPAVQPAPASPAPPVAAPSHLIREGFGVGGVELGMARAEVERVLGKPVEQNAGGGVVVFQGYHASEIFGVYYDEAERVRLIIAAMKDKTWCTSFDVCLYREGDLAKLKAHHGAKLFRFVDRDGGIYYRLLSESGGKQIMTEYTPVEERNGVVQVAISFWSGPIDKSTFD